MLTRVMAGAGAAIAGLLAATGGQFSVVVLVLAGLAGGLLPVVLVGLGWWPVAAAGVAGFGSGVQSTWFDSTGAGVKSLAGLVLGLGLGWGLTRVGMRAGRETRWLMAALLMAGVVLARTATLVFGEAQSGRLELPLLPPIMTGEWGRALAVIAAGLALTGADLVREGNAFGQVSWRQAWGWVLFVVAPCMAAAGVMILMGDLGPAVLLSSSVGVMIWRALGARLALPVLSVAGIGVAVMGLSSREWALRWAEVRDPRGLSNADQDLRQLATALRSMGETGLVGGGPGSGALTHAVPAGNSDYAIATVAGDYGLLVAWTLIAVMVVLSVLILRRSVSCPAESGLIATGAGWMLAATTIWVTAGTFGLIPFTGVNAPLIAMSASAAGAAGVLLGASGAALRELGDGEPSIPAARVTLIASVTALVVGVGVIVQGGWLTINGGGGRMPGESSLRGQRGALLYSDGSPLATSGYKNGALVRRYADEELVTFAGEFDTKIKSVWGLEKIAAGAATCGDHQGWLGRLITLGVRDECSPRDVVTTLDPKVQAAVSQLVKDHPAAEIIVTDRASGGITALAAGQMSSWGSKGKPADGSVFTDAAPPGSVFKLVTATAAVQGGLTIPALGANLELPGGGTLPNQWNGPCPQSGIAAMLTYSCNTSAGWVGLQVGAAGLQKAADTLGYGSMTLSGPPDLSNGEDPLTWPDRSSATTGMSASANKSQAGVARTAIGQQGARAAVADINGITDAVMSGKRRPLTFVAGWCQDGQLQTWTAPSSDIATDLAVVREGMTGAVTAGTARNLGALGAQAAKTGTAQTDHGNISWATVATAHYLITARVTPTEENRYPRTGAGGAVDLVAALLDGNLNYPEPTNPCAGR